MAEPTRHIGVRRPRIDARERVVGATRYAADLDRAGVLHARIVPSVYAHANIRSVQVADALAVPGVVAVLTAADLPIVGRGAQRRFEPLARGEVVFAGQPVALVIAETEAAAEGAVGLVEVDLEPLEAVVDVLAAMEPDGPLARGRGTPRTDDTDDDSEPGPLTSGEADSGASEVSGNVFSRRREQRGDVAPAFARCDAIVEGRFAPPGLIRGIWSRTRRRPGWSPTARSR